MSIICRIFADKRREKEKLNELLISLEKRIKRLEKLYKLSLCEKGEHGTWEFYQPISSNSSRFFSEGLPFIRCSICHKKMEDVNVTKK